MEQKGPGMQIQVEININLILDGYLNVRKRTRYSVWDLLGDVGGLHDGLVILLSILIVPFSTFSFSNDFINDKFVDGSTSKRARAY